MATFQIAFIYQESGTGYTQTVQPGQTVSPSTASSWQNITKQGYERTELWYTNPDYSGSPVEFPTQVWGPVTFYLKWIPIISIVQFKYTDNSGEVILSQQDVPWGESATLPEDPVRSSFSFTGWTGAYQNLRPDTNGFVYEVIAGWEPAYNITFTKFETTSWVPWITIQVPTRVGALTEIPGPHSVPNDREFVHWSTAHFGDRSTAFNFMNITGHTHLYPYFVWQSYDVQFLDHQGNLWEQQSVQHHQFATAPTTNPSKSGAVFIGWNPTISSATIQGPTTYTPVFESQYNVWFDSRGGSFVEGTEVNSSTDYKIPQPAPPTRDNHTFLGWFTQVSGGDLWNFNTVIESDIVLYAQWEFHEVENDTKVTYDNEGNLVAGEHKDFTFSKIQMSHEQEYDVILSGKFRQNTEARERINWTTGYYEVFLAKFNLEGEHLGNERIGSLANPEENFTIVDPVYGIVTRELTFTVEEDVYEAALFMKWSERGIESNVVTDMIVFDLHRFETEIGQREIEIVDEQRDFIINRAFAEFGSFTTQLFIHPGKLEDYVPAPASEFIDIHSCNKMFTDSSQIILYGSLYKTGNWYKTVIRQYDYITLRNSLNFQTNKKERVVACLALEGNIIVFADNEDLGGSIHRVYGNGDDYDAGDGYFSPYRRKLVNSTMSCDHKGSLQFTENFLVFKYRRNFYMIDSRDLNADRLEVTMVSDKVQAEEGLVVMPEVDNLNEFSVLSEMTENYYGVIFTETGDRWKLYYNMPFNYEGKNKLIYPWLRDKSELLKIDDIITLNKTPTHIYKNKLIQYKDWRYRDLEESFDTIIVTKGYSITEVTNIVKFVDSVTVKFYRSTDDQLDFDFQLYSEANHLLMGDKGVARYDPDKDEIVWTKFKEYELPAFTVGEIGLGSRIGRDLFTTKVYNINLKRPCLSAYAVLRLRSNESFKLSSITFGYTSTDMPAYDLGKLYSEIIGGNE